MPLVASWRVQMIWSNGKTRSFGKFSTKKKAAQWIKEHAWLKAQVINDSELRVRGGPRKRIDPPD